MGVPAGTEAPAVNHHVAVQHDDRVGGGVAVTAGFRTGSIADDVVLGAGVLVVVEEFQFERAVVRRLFGGAKRDRVQVGMDDWSTHTLVVLLP